MENKNTLAILELEKQEVFTSLLLTEIENLENVEVKTLAKLTILANAVSETTQKLNDLIDE